MPAFLEKALAASGSKRGLSGKDLKHYIYGSMNNIGAMHGNKETAKGAAMDQKHMEDEEGKGNFEDPSDSHARRSPIDLLEHGLSHAEKLGKHKKEFDAIVKARQPTGANKDLKR